MRSKLATTLRLLRENNVCRDRYLHLRRALGKHYGDDRPISLLRVLRSNGLDDALWALRAVPPEQAVLRDKIARLLACDYAARVLHMRERAYPDDTRPRDCIVVARRFAVGRATAEELEAVWAAAGAGGEAAWAAAGEADYAAIGEGAGATTWAASGEAVGRAAWDAERNWQKERLRHYLRPGPLPRPVPLPRRPR